MHLDFLTQGEMAFSSEGGGHGGGSFLVHFRYFPEPGDLELELTLEQHRVEHSRRINHV